MTFEKVKNRYIDLFESNIENIFIYEIKESRKSLRKEYLIEYNEIHDLYYCRIHKPYTSYIEGFYITNSYSVWLYIKDKSGNLLSIPFDKKNLQDINLLEKIIQKCRD